MYWEPHSSSIDFCESNYYHFDSIVEFHNTWSSLIGITLLGLIGAIWNNPTNEFRTVLAYLVIVLIGLGSFGLHLSLHWIYQASDELPMLYFNNILHFMWLEYDAPIGQPNWPKLPYVFAIWSIIQTVLYYRFQNNFLVFLSTFAFGITLHLVMFYNIAYQGGARRGPIPKQLGAMSLFAYFAVGAPVWVLDMNHCNTILHISETCLPDNLGLLRGITPHVLWHFAAAFATYCAISWINACRMEELKIPFRLEHWWGVVPITTRMEDAKSI